MFLFNVTTHLEATQEDEWLAYMQEEHIPKLIEGGYFQSATLTKVMVEEPMGGVTYSVQYSSDHKAVINGLYDRQAADLEATLRKKFGSELLSFKTPLKIISQHGKTPS
ncbi:MAG: DUF4286 family protein [Flavobacteriaceae bacterium]|jgi:hypothetical protein|nr:DUF4286 family protein [Flavobacteriaceae bacterium LSUCC0859]MCI4642984.1 DUF4286 family protein [Flavobacteriaceae bacterium]MCI5089271.1 DUF4286 family protein [Flavobacteriaceae bacterium]CAI8179145.1 MAG: Uncharacterised protein [SAR116 cluster bacterium]